MPYQASWKDRGVYVRFWGNPTRTDLFSAVDEVAADPRFDDIRFRISDFTGLTSLDIDSQDIRVVSAMTIAHRLTNPRMLDVSIADAPEIQALLADWKATHPAPHLAAIVPTKEAARHWIANHLHLLQSESAWRQS